MRRRACVTDCESDAVESGSDAVENIECYMGCCPGIVLKHPVDGLYNICYMQYVYVTIFYVYNIIL